MASYLVTSSERTCLNLKRRVLLKYTAHCAHFYIYGILDSLRLC